MRIALTAALLALSLLPAIALPESSSPDCCRSNILEQAQKLNSADDQLRWDALTKIGLYGAEAGSAVPALVNHLANKEDVSRTVVVLGQIGPPAKAAVPELVSLLTGALDNKDKHSQEVALACEIISTLTRIAERKELMIPPLRKALLHPYSRIRYEAVYALGVMGAAAKPALPDLKRLSLEDNERPPLYLFQHGTTVAEAAKESIIRIQSHKGRL